MHMSDSHFAQENTLASFESGYTLGILKGLA